MSVATRIKDWAAELFVRAEQRGRFRKLPAFERNLSEYPELSVLTASGERIAQRMESAAATPRVAREIPDMPLPSTSILSRLERAAQ